MQPGLAERYRSGRNGGASKASCRVTGTWVRIPPSPPSFQPIKSMAFVELPARWTVLTMPRSGLWIADTIALRGERIKGNKLFLYTQKTGTPVYVPLPPAGTRRHRSAFRAPERPGELVAVSGHGVRGREGLRRALASVPRHVRRLAARTRRVDRECVRAARPFVSADHGAALQAVGHDAAEEPRRRSAEGVGLR